MTFWQYFFLNHQAEIKQSKKADILNTEVTVISDGEIMPMLTKISFLVIHSVTHIWSQCSKAVSFRNNDYNS